MAKIDRIRQKSILIDLGEDQKRNLKYDLNAFALIEEEYGSVDGAMEKMEQGSFIAIRYVLWAGLQHEEENLTVKDVGSIINIADLEYVAEKMNEAMTAGLPEKPDTGDTNHPN